MIENKLLGIILNNIELYENFKNYGNIFLDDNCNKLFKIITSIKKKHKQINIDLIIEYVRQNNIFDIDKFYEIYDSAYNEDDYKALLSKVLTKNFSKSLRDYILQLKNEDKNYIDIKYDIQNLLDNINNIEDQEITDTKKGCLEMLNKLKDDYTPQKVSSCIEEIDNNQMGYDPTDYIIIGAAESVGKTSMAIDLILRQLQKGLRIAFFSCEMKKKKIQVLMACNLSEIDTLKIDLNLLTTIEKDKFIRKGVEKLYNKPLFIDDQSRYWNDIRRKIKMLKKKENIDIVYIDYLQYIRVKDIRTSYERLEEVSSGIKNLAKELEIPIVVIAALNRAGKSEDEPRNSHIKGNGDIEYDADIICLLKTVTMAIDGDSNKRQVDRKITKNRNGKLSKESMIFYPAVRKYKRMFKNG